MARTYFVYILASETRELYIGVTNNLERRLAEHRGGYDPGSYSLRHGTRVSVPSSSLREESG